MTLISRRDTMTKLLVFGHQSPDTDTITSAIVYSHLKQSIGEEAEAVRLGEINQETQYALDYFEVEAPRLLEDMKADHQDVVLVDHNEFQQSAVNIKELTIHGVIDHHRVSNFETEGPLYMRIEPVGCTATVLYTIYKEHQVEIPQHIAGLMLSAIISDTLLLKSPTCTERDIEVANQLAKIADVDINTYGFEMLKKGASIDGMSAADIVGNDAKSFELNGHTVRIAQINTVDPVEILALKDDLLQNIDERIERDNYDLYMLVITNILDNDSIVLTKGLTDKVDAAFDVKVEDSEALLKDVVSRKKQIVPPLTNAFNA